MRLRTRYTQRLPTAPGLRLDIPFFEGSGTKVLDVSGKGNHGTIHDAVWASGEHGVAMSFNGTSAYIDCGDKAEFEFAAGVSFTLTAWYKGDWSENSTNGLITKGYGDSSANYPLYMMYVSDTTPFGSGVPGDVRLGLMLRNAAGSSVLSPTYPQSTTDVADGTWHYLVVVVDKTALKAYIYVDGVQEASADITSDVAEGVNTDSLILMTHYNRYTPGYIGEARIYAAALTAEQIKRRYEQTKRSSDSKTYIVKTVTTNGGYNAGMSFKGPAGIARPAHIFPVAVHFKGIHDRTYIVFANHPLLDPWIKYYDHDTGLWSDEYKVGDTHNYAYRDSHGNPAITIDADGYIYVLWSGHADPLHCRKTTNPEDISSWNNFTSYGDVYTYPNAFFVGDTLVVFIRYHRSNILLRSTDGGQNWASTTLITQWINEHGYYGRGWQNPKNENEFHYTWRRHDTNPDDDHRVWYMKSMDGGYTWTKANGDPITIPATPPDDMELLIEPPSDNKTEIPPPWIENGNAHYILHCIDTNLNAYHIAYNSDQGQWETKQLPENLGYSALYGHDFPKLILYADGNSWFEKATSAAVVYESTDAGESWSKTAVLNPAALCNFWMARVYNAHPELQAIWTYGNWDVDEAHEILCAGIE